VGRQLLRAFSALGAIGIVWLGVWIAYLGRYYYLSELHSSYGSVPHWKSAVIVGLIAACILASLYAGFKLMKFAATGNRN